MSIDPRKIEYLKLAVGDVVGLVDSIRQIGESVESVRTRFELMREWLGIREQLV
jgi:hypothetical protein